MAQGWDPTDSDSDGISDQWETTYFGDLSRDGALDYDSDGLPDSLEFRSGRNPTIAETVAGTPDKYSVPGTLYYERWDSVEGSNLANLYSSAAFKQPNPSAVGYCTSAEIDQDYADNYGVRLRGTLKAPVTGDYRFYIASDNQGELYLSTDGNRFHMQKICCMEDWTGYQEWTASTTQESAVITLTAGQECHFEALMKEGEGGDHFSIGWIRPGETTVELVPGKMPDGTVVLTSYAPEPNGCDLDDDGLPDEWEDSHGLNSTSRVDHGLLDSDGDGENNLIEYQTEQNPLPPQGAVGFCQWDKFLIGPNNGKLNDLTSNPLFAQLPAQSGFFNAPEAGQDLAECFGQRIRGVITIPADGTWNFYISGDDSCGLWINPVGPSRFGKTQVAFSTAPSGFRDFMMQPTQKSRDFTFTAGQKVYFEALYVDSYYNDHCSVGWSGPGFESATLIPSANISLCEPEIITDGGVNYDNDVDNDSLPDNWETDSVIGLAVSNNGAEAWLNGEYGDPDGDGLTNLQEYQNGTNPLIANGVPGKWQHQFFGNVLGMRVVDLNGLDGFLRAPDFVELSDSPEVFRDIADNYGQRFRATIKAPATAAYTFWVSGDEDAEIWLSTNDLKFERRRIATTGGFITGFRSWDDHPCQKSAPITLEANQSYFIEVLHKESQDGDHVSVAWSCDPPTNWAFAGNGAVATQSSTGFDGMASRANDGNTNGSWEASSVSHTDNDLNSWYQVDFGVDRTVNRVVLYNRTDETLGSRLSNFRVSLLDSNDVEIPGAAQNFYDQGSGYAPPVLTWNLSSTFTARKVKVQFLGYNNDGDGYLSLAELEAYEVTSEHFSRELLPPSVLTSFVNEDDDDDDYLPDSWEGPYGLSVTDNGSIDPREGQYGDWDGDGLTNLEEYQLHTNPAVADTDGDGLSDKDERDHYHTDPTIPNSVVAGPATTLDLSGFSSSSVTWQTREDGSILADERRGWTDYPVTVIPGEEGIYEIRITGGAEGVWARSVENLPISLKLDGDLLARQTMTCLSGENTTIKQLTPWLVAGTHIFRIENSNVRAGCYLRLSSITIAHLSGGDGNNGPANGVPDWVDEKLANENHLTRIPAESRTSPVSIEGLTSSLASLQILKAVIDENGQPAMQAQDIIESVNQGFYSNISLNPSAETDLTFSFQNGGLVKAETVTWTTTNIMELTAPLTVRAGSSLKFTAHDPAAAPAGIFTLTQAAPESPITTIATDQDSAVPLVVEFTTSGTYTLTATWTPPDNGTPQTATLTVNVKSADFGPEFLVQTWNHRTWDIPAEPGINGMTIEANSDIAWAETTAVGAVFRSFFVNVYQTGNSYVIARLPETGEIIARGVVRAFTVARASETEDSQEIETRPDGSRLFRFTVVADALPDNAELRFGSFFEGATFPDGSRTLVLRASDFSENGIAEVFIEWAGDLSARLCHTLTVVIDE